MGLDFTVSEVTESRLDSKGRHTYVTTELDNFGHSGYKMMDYGLGAQENCTTVSYDGIQFIKTTGKDEYKEKQSLENAIQVLQDFIDTEELTEDTERVFDIHVWF